MKFLHNIFGKSEPDRRDMDQLIFDLAEHDNRPADLDELYRRMAGIEVFAKVLSADFPLQNGARHTVGPGQNLQIQSTTLPTGHFMAQFFVDGADARLRPQFVRIALLKPELRRLLKDELSKP